MAEHTRIRITPPEGEPVTIMVKRSTLVRLEDEVGEPILARINAGFTGGLYKLAYAAGRDNGVIPEGLSFDDFVDADGDTWDFELIAPDAESADPND